MTRYEITYDYTDDCGNDDFNITETFDGSWSELRAYINQMRKNGCYNINATALYEFDDVLYG